MLKKNNSQPNGFFPKHIIPRIEKIVHKAAKYHRWVILTALILLVGLEYSEFRFKISDFFHLGEVLVYSILLAIMGVLIEMVFRANRAQQSTLKLLEQKHELSLEIMPHQNWDYLVGLLTKRLAKIMNAHQASLSIYESYQHRFEMVAEWVEEGFVGKPLADLACQECVGITLSAMPGREYCTFPKEQTSSSAVRVYCHPVYYKNNPYALIKFIFDPGQVPSSEQRKILETVNDEIVIALVAGRDRQRLSELELAEATLAERHAVSQYLHDNLSQNIGYLRMKLDQISHQLDPLTASDFHSEIHHMRDVADESYNIVREKLESIHLDTLPVLNNLLNEHGRKISQRANFNFDCSILGSPKVLSLEIQRTIFYVFQEILSNIERHAGAARVNVVLDWRSERFVLTISDDGMGFNPQSERSSTHLGLEIVRERLDGIKGFINIRSSPNSGTIVEITVPYSVKTPDMIYE